MNMHEKNKKIKFHGCIILVDFHPGKTNEFGKVCQNSHHQGAKSMWIFDVELSFEDL